MDDYTEAANDTLPTVQEAKRMFFERADLTAVLTDEGMLYRTGELVPA